MVLPIDADAQQVYVVCDKRLQGSQLSEGTGESEIEKGHSLHDPFQGCCDILQPYGRKYCETERSGVAVSVIGVQTERMFI